MADDVDALFALLRSRSRVTAWPAVYVSLEDDHVLCDIANGDATGRVPARVMTPYRPEVGEQVALLAIDGTFFLVGPALPKPASGTVIAVSSSSVRLSTDVGEVVATYDQGATLSASQVVKLMWSDGAHVLGVIASPGAPVQPPAPPEPAPSVHVDVFQALDAASFSDGAWRQGQPWAADGVLAAWFYGSKIADTLAGATVAQLEVWVSLVDSTGGTVNVGTHAYPSRPAGEPVIAGAIPVQVTGGWVPLPLEFGAFLANTAGGIGLAHGGPTKFRSLAEDAQSGALRITSTY